MGFINWGVFAHAQLKDARQSFIEILNYKKLVLSHMLGDWLTSSGITAAAQKEIRETYSSFEGVRSRSSGYPDGQEANRSWRVGLPVCMPSS